MRSKNFVKIPALKEILLKKGFSCTNYKCALTFYLKRENIKQKWAASEKTLCCPRCQDPVTEL